MRRPPDRLEVLALTGDGWWSRAEMAGFSEGLREGLSPLAAAGTGGPLPAFRRSVPAEEREQLAVRFATLEAELTAQEYAHPGTVPLADRDPQEYLAANS